MNKPDPADRLKKIQTPSGPSNITVGLYETAEVSRLSDNAFGKILRFDERFMGRDERPVRHPQIPLMFDILVSQSVISGREVRIEVLARDENLLAGAKISVSRLLPVAKKHNIWLSTVCLLLGK